jgi:hypothetical protein
MKISCLYLVLGLCSVANLYADGLVYKLPADGTLARYKVHSKMTLPDNGKQIATDGSLTIASVGSTKIDGLDCRWIEMVLEVNLGPGKTDRSIFKGLIPEKYLAKGENPQGQWIKGWVKLGQGQPQALSKEMLANPTLKLNLIVTGPLQDAKPLKKKEVDTVLGQVSCEGQSGTLLVKGGSVMVKDGVATVGDAKVLFQNYFHDKAPFGVAWSRMRMPSNSGTVEEELSLAEVRADAKSQLPDQE